MNTARASWGTRSMSHNDGVEHELSGGYPCPDDECDRTFKNSHGAKIHYSVVHTRDQDEYPCPWKGCDRVFNSERGLKIHHSQTHGESIAGVTVTCAWCDTPKSVIKSRAEAYENHFCNIECKGEWRSENLVGEDHPSWAGGGIEVECAWCGASKSVDPSMDASRTRHFCDMNCKGKWQSENRRGENATRWYGGEVEVECAWCGTPKSVERNAAQKRDRHFCDHECHGEWRSENWCGKNSPTWSGGTFPYGPGWNESKRETVRERDDRRCQNCGLSEEDHLKEHGKKHSVHHIHKARAVDDPEVHNHPDNLVTLCQTKDCHQRWEKMSPLRPVVDTPDD